MIIKCICGFACERKGDLIYHIDTDLKHREQTGSQLYELILKTNKLIQEFQEDHDQEGLIYTEKKLEDVALLIWDYKDWELEQVNHRSSLVKKHDENL